jgi:parallel beta-helix repeat protein
MNKRYRAELNVFILLILYSSCINFKEKTFPELNCTPPGENLQCLLEKGKDYGVFIQCAANGSGAIPTKDSCNCTGKNAIGNIPCITAKCPQGLLEDSKGECTIICPECCPEGTIIANAVGCVPVGPQSCPEGWKKIEGGGYEPILSRCDENEIQLIGGCCEKVGPQDECGEGIWGNIPNNTADGKIWYVWADYSGSDSDGTKDKPYTKIQDAINNAGSGDTIAIGAEKKMEKYKEGLKITKSIHLIGRCSKMVKITGEVLTIFPNITAAISFNQPNPGSRLMISNLTVSGSGSGIVIFGGSKHELKNVRSSWNHGYGLLIYGLKNILDPEEKSEDISEQVIINNCDFSYNMVGKYLNSGVGIEINKFKDVEIANSTIINNIMTGINIISSIFTLKSSIIKDNLQEGIFIKDCPQGKILTCYIDGNFSSGIKTENSTNLIIESNIIKDTKQAIIVSDAVTGFNIICGYGVTIQDNSEATIKSCFIEGNTVNGILVLSDSHLTFESSTIEGSHGIGINVQEGSQADIKNSSIIGNTEFGVYAVNSSITVSSNIIRDTKQNGHGYWGGGIFLETSENFSIKSNIITNNYASGITLIKSRGDVVNNLVSDIKESRGKWLTEEVLVDAESIADGIAIIYSSGNVTIDSNYLKNCKRAGVIFDYSTGKFIHNIIEKSIFGYVTQNSEVTESGNIFIDNEYDTNPDSNKPLPVNYIEVPIPEPPNP